jgi:hypothetical protein
MITAGSRHRPRRPGSSRSQLQLGTAVPCRAAAACRTAPVGRAASGSASECLAQQRSIGMSRLVASRVRGFCGGGGPAAATRTTLGGGRRPAARFSRVGAAAVCYSRRSLSTIYDSQSGLTIELPTGIHLHDVGMCGTPLPQSEAERAAWEAVLTAYASSEMIRTVELPDRMLAADAGAEPGVSPAWAENLLGADTAAAISAAAADGSLATTEGWSHESTLVTVAAAVGKVDGLDPDESVEDAVAAAEEASKHWRQPCFMQQPLLPDFLLVQRPDTVCAAVVRCAVLVANCRPVTLDSARGR